LWSKQIIDIIGMLMISASESASPGLSTSDQVRASLEDRIFSETYKPGDRLREAHLAREFQVSQSTIREALIRLENEGLVVRVANKRTIVTKLSNADIRERLSMRISLESLAAIEASRRMRDEHLALLGDRLKTIKDCKVAKDVRKFNQADLEFHRCIWEMSGNRTLYRTLNQLTAPLFAFVTMVRKTGMETLRPHQPIADAIAQADPELIYSAIFEHIATSYNDFLTSDAEIHRMVCLGRRDLS
jgi:DNA-binding GntR family transcriptional regulator